MGKQKKKISSKETRKLVCFLASSATATHRLADSGVSSLWPHTTLGPSQGRFSKSSHNAANPGTTAKKIKRFPAAKKKKKKKKKSPPPQKKKKKKKKKKS